MPFPHERHPQELRDRIGELILAGQTAPQVGRALEAGQVDGVEPCLIPLSTIRYYGQQARKRHAAAGLTDRAKGDLGIAIESMARELLSEYDQELKKVRTAKTRDMDKLAAITKGLKDLRGLAGTGRTEAQTSKPAAKPADPFLASIAKAGDKTA